MIYLLPLDCADGLRGQVKQDTVDALHLVGDAVRNVVQQGIGDLLDGGGHGIGGIDRTEDGGPAVIPLAVPDTDALEVGHSDEILPDLAL